MLFTVLTFKTKNIILLLSLGSAVGTATGYKLEERRVAFLVPKESRIFTSHIVQSGFWAHPSILVLVFAGVKRKRLEADLSPSTSAEITKTWIYTSTTPYAIMA
jgi:hypothetical protein